MTEDLPPSPNQNGIRRYGDSPEQAKAEGIKKFTDPESVKMMSAVREEEVPILAFLIHLGRDTDLNIEWAEEYANTILELKKSAILKVGGITSEQLKEILKEPQIPMQGQGLWGSIKSRFGNLGSRF